MRESDCNHQTKLSSFAEPSTQSKRQSYAFGVKGADRIEAPATAKLVYFQGLGDSLMSTPTPRELALTHAVADGLPDGIFVASAPSGAFAYANRAFYEILGVPPAPLAQAGSLASSYGIRTRAGDLYP